MSEAQELPFAVTGKGQSGGWRDVIEIVWAEDEEEALEMVDTDGWFDVEVEQTKAP